ncbi:unnamed protein product [Orchesella dallaii]|uniref:Uncharacterized protein n=1 Tax=Orchesella dallaii TaxID=48710 RepID=A0ABP1QCK4_9HEXA
MRQFILQSTSGKITKINVNSPIDKKTPVSHKSTAMLFEIKSNLEPHYIIYEWKRVNANWNFDISSRKSHAIQKDSGCDDMRKLFSEVTKYIIDVQTCITNIIYHRHNSSDPEIKALLNFLLLYGTISHAKVQRPYYVYRFGYHFTSHRFAYFLEHEKGNEINILSVFKPVPLMWWLLLLSVAVCLAILFKYFKVYNPPLVLFKIALEQSTKLNSMRFVGCVLVGLWLFACILIRNVYTSTIYSILTAKSLPDIPETLEDALENYTNFDIVYNWRVYLELIVQSKPMNSSEPVDDDLNLLWRRGQPLYKCNLRFNFEYKNFLEPLSQSSGILCFAHPAGTNPYFLEPYQPGGSWSNFILIYNTELYFNTMISIFGNRWRYDGLQHGFNVTMEGYLSSFQTIFSALAEDNLRDLEHSGILQRLVYEYSSLRTLLRLKTEVKRFRNKLKRGVNFYTALHQSNKLMSEFGRKRNGDMNSVQLESVLVAWVLYGLMLIVSYGIISFEVMHWQMQY